VKRAAVLSHKSFLVEVEEGGQSELWYIPDYSYHYGVPSAPPSDALGDRREVLGWLVGISTGGGPVGYGLWARVVVTGNDRWIRLYYFPGTGSQYRLLKYANPAGEVYTRYDFYGKARDWNLQLAGAMDEPNDKLRLIVAHESGHVTLASVYLHIQPSGEGYFTVSSALDEGESEACCACWALGDYYFPLTNPRFLSYADGSLGLVSGYVA
jgi:hypothetical protein